MLILCFPHESATAQTLLAHSSSNQRKIWHFRKWWNFHISEIFQNLILPLNHTSRYPLQYSTHWLAMVSLRMGENIKMQKHPQRSKAPLMASNMTAKLWSTYWSWIFWRRELFSWQDTGWYHPKQTSRGDGMVRAVIYVDFLIQMNMYSAVQDIRTW